MSLPIKKIELVSPAGGWEQLVAAINAGADAVYLGYKQYGARAYAENFSFPQLKKAVETAHDNNVRAYLTLNTILKDTEIKELAYFLNEYLDYCNDGIIIQDFGLFSMIKELFPRARIHASTQLNIHNLRSVQFLKGLRFSRVVLAREMTVDEISAISGVNETSGINDSTKNSVELEVFGHGSQCYSYSGSCYLCSFTGSRSGNRGRCSQPCRMKYSLEATCEASGKSSKTSTSKTLINDSFIISKADLMTLEIIPRLASAGISALKIEGRMKSAEYVGIITSLYRKYLDLYYRDPGNYTVAGKDIYKAAQIFSREMGTGYLLEKFPEKIISLKKSGSIGNFLGRIKSTEKRALVIKSNIQVEKGDIIEIWTNRGNERLKVYGRNIIPGKDGKKLLRIETDRDPKSRPGDRVFKFYDAEIDREAKSLYKNGIIAVNSFRPEDVQHPGKLAKQELEEYFNDEQRVPGSVIENYGSSATAVKDSSVKKVKSPESNTPYLSVEVYSLKDAEALSKHHSANSIKNLVLNSFEEVFSQGKDYKEKVKVLDKTCKNKSINLVIKTPGIIYDEWFEIIENNLNRLIKLGINNFSMSNPGVIQSFMNCVNGTGQAKDRNIINIHLDHSLNIFNSRALRFFLSIINKSPGLNTKNITLSAELSLEEIKKIIKLPGSNSVCIAGPVKNDFSIYSYGYYPVMMSRFKMGYLDRDCDRAKNYATEIIREHYLADRKGYRFRILSDYNDNLIFLNSKKICNFFDIPLFLKDGISFFYIDTRTFKSYEILEILEFYNKAVEMIYMGKATEYESLCARAQKSSLFSDYTRGHFFRELL